jgi:hypothetical protein
MTLWKAERDSFVSVHEQEAKKLHQHVQRSPTCLMRRLKCCESCESVTKTEKSDVLGCIGSR